MITPRRQPAMIPAMGRVIIQPMYIQVTILQLMLLHVPLVSPTPTVAPVIHCVVEIGNPSRVARMTVIADPSSIENPREGE